jgi:hypothetical protein
MALVIRAKKVDGKIAQKDLEALKNVMESAERMGFSTDFTDDPGVNVILSSGPSYRNALLGKLPDHLRITAEQIVNQGPSTAQQVCDYTKRARAVESGYLNQLEVMGLLKKERKGRKAYYSINPTSPMLQI